MGEERRNTMAQFIYSKEVRRNKIRKGKTVWLDRTMQDNCKVEKRTGDKVLLTDGRKIDVDDVLGQFVTFGWEGIVPQWFAR
jgi:hypothetical protein